MEFDIKTVSSIIAVVTLQGGLVLAAAKSIFITKKEYKEMLNYMNREKDDFDRKLYDNNRIPIYMQKTEYTKSIQGLERRSDTLHVNLCEQIARISNLIEKIRTTQESMNVAISKLQARGER